MHNMKIRFMIALPVERPLRFHGLSPTRPPLKLNPQRFLTKLPTLEDRVLRQRRLFLTKDIDVIYGVLLSAV